ncbi:phosphoribosylformylglycinamidine cyclo-ligase [Patescibacteria group bacterium]|nr:phosphoribosylformylglycinamidine cyclo-ligase [Patescibacteria group bacterium]MBU4481810.1 phosphoribosylformylglycinamidine cyclo-ligase [Patescibacteria group bacterium]
MKSYALAGVNRELREKAKRFLRDFETTFKFSKYGKIIKTPFNALYPIGKNIYQVKTSDGVGTKALLADLAKKHDTIGIDAVAMVVNDCLRCGARPIALTDTIIIKKSEPKLLTEIQKGLMAGAREAECPIVGGEIADVPELLNTAYDLICDCVGEVNKEKIITGEKIKQGDIIIGFRSSGIHSNGLTLARKVLFKKWGGKYETFAKIKGFSKPLIYECLEPTKIYVKPFLKIAEKHDILGAIHITGDSYLKFRKLRGNFGFEFFNFKPQPIFKLIQETGNISDEEMFKTFNMGWGFAIIVKKNDSEKILGFSKKIKIDAEIIGEIIKEKKIIINYQNKKIIL